MTDTDPPQPPADRSTMRSPMAASHSSPYRRQKPPFDDDTDAADADEHRMQNGDDGYVPQQIAVCNAMIVCAVAILGYTVINALRELFQVYQQKWHYLFEMNSVVSWFLYVSATIMVVPVFNGGHIADLHYSAASVTVFLSWFNLLLFLQRFDQVGIYVVMFLEILQTLIKVLTVFSILIIAFGLSFFILMSKVSGCYFD